MFPTRALFKRSVWKGPFVAQLPVPLVRPKEGERYPAIRTQARSCTIVPHFVGWRFGVHNGKTYEEFMVTEDMVGHKLGEFSSTRKKFQYKLSKNK